jgi:predicted ABC-class ATPase
MAFADINEDNISSLLRSKDSKSTQRSVVRSIKLFKDYLLQKDESVDFETFLKEKLNEMLRMFYASLRKKGILTFITRACIMIRLFITKIFFSENTKKITQIM